MTTPRGFRLLALFVSAVREVHATCGSVELWGTEEGLFVANAMHMRDGAWGVSVAGTPLKTLGGAIRWTAEGWLFTKGAHDHGGPACEALRRALEGR